MAVTITVNSHMIQTVCSQCREYRQTITLVSSDYNKKDEDKERMKSIMETVQKNSEMVKAMPSAYQIRVTDLMELLDDTENKVSEPVLEAVRIAYEYGMLKGRRYEQNKAKRNTLNKN